MKLTSLLLLIASTAWAAPNFPAQSQPNSLAPNVAISGKAAQDIFTALDSVKTIDGTQLLIICNTNACGYNIMNSYWVPVSQGALPNMSAVWLAFENSVTANSLQPNPPIKNTGTILNARDFTWDGTTLSFNLKIDDATLPPSLPPHI